MLSGRKKKKTTKGRQKVELKRIENEDARYISFSKRRNGVFAKASEISTLCGAEVLALIYSPAGKPHSFGSPDVDQLADRFFSGGGVHPVASQSEQNYQKGRLRGLNGRMMELSRSVEALKARNNSVLERTMSMIQGLDLDENEDDMTLEKLAELNNKLVDLKEQIRGLFDHMPRGGWVSAPVGGPPASSSSYAFVERSMQPFAESGHGPVQRDMLNYHRASQGSVDCVVNPFERALGPSGWFRTFDLTRDVVNLSDRKTLASNSNPFMPEFYQGGPSSSTNQGPKLNNFF